ncbi:DUF4232 domain-containing protein [Actinoplanes subglobosus]|uniref:DUF4232 domain-containing protein n=1 Tax=Actinoplanes subglobosus TaxID=1547892 RepID=A0ABV8J0M5_9ACTN
MTRNSPRSSALRALMALTPALLVTGIAVALVGGGRASEAAAGAMPTAQSSETPAGAVSATVPSPACLTDDLAGTVTGQPGGAAREATLSLTNTADHTCEIHGWADVALVTPPGDVVRVPTRKLGTAGPAIILAPGAATESRLQWDTCTASGKGCGVGVTFQYIADPDSTGVAADLADLPEADNEGITVKSLRIYPLQPATT